MIKPFNSSFFCSSLYIHVYFKDCVIRPHRLLIYRYFAWMHIFRFYLWRGLDIQSYIRVILLEPTLTWKHAELKKKLSFFFKLSWIMHGLFVYQSYSLSVFCSSTYFSPSFKIVAFLMMYTHQIRTNSVTVTP